MPTSPPTDQPLEFATVLLAAGDAHERATVGLADLVAAVHRTGRAGSLVIQLYIRPDGGREVDVAVGVRARMPEAPAERVRMVTTAAGWIGVPGGGPEQLALPVTPPRIEPAESAADR